MKSILIATLSLCILTSCSKGKNETRFKEITTFNLLELDSASINHINNIPKFTATYSHEAMILGTFHFNRSSDGSDIVAKNHIDVSTDENQ